MNLLGRILWIILVIPLLGYFYHFFTTPRALDSETIEVESEQYNPEDYESNDD